MKTLPLTLAAAALAFSLSMGLACKSNGETSAVTTAPASGTLAIEANAKGFTPSSVSVKKGAAVTLVFKRTSEDTCATEVVFPELGIKKDLPLNQAVPVEIPAGEAKTLTFQCGMGMFKGKVVIS